MGSLEHPTISNNVINPIVYRFILFSSIWPRGVSYWKLHRNYPTMWVSLLFEGYTPLIGVLV